MTWTKVLCHCGHERGDHHTDTKGRLICDHYNDCGCDDFRNKSEPKFNLNCRRYLPTPWSYGWEALEGPTGRPRPTQAAASERVLVPNKAVKDYDAVRPSIWLYLPQGDLLDDITVWMKP